jgi:hypothetical protein
MFRVKLSVRSERNDYLEEFLISNATVENLFDKHLLIRVLELHKIRLLICLNQSLLSCDKLMQVANYTYIFEEFISMRVDSFIDRVEGLNAFDALLD